MQFQRYALYVMADDPALARFGASWLGWDAMQGVPVAHPPSELPIETITQTPRKYGFHGTLHWPFLLTDPTEVGLARLTEDVTGFAAAHPSIRLDGLELARLGRFLALVPVGETGDLVALAARLVRQLAPFRAPPSEADLARRRTAHLSAAQDAMLTTWGYPYVMDQFRFHMTLTGKLPKAQLPQVEAVLHTLLKPVLPRPFMITALSLMGEDTGGRFHLIKRAPLGG